MYVTQVLVPIIHLWNTFVCFLSRELFGIQERFSVSNKATSGLLGGKEVSYTPVHLYNILVITCVLGFASDLGNN